MPLKPGRKVILEPVCSTPVFTNNNRWGLNKLEAIKAIRSVFHNMDLATAKALMDQNFGTLAADEFINMEDFAYLCAALGAARGPAGLRGEQAL